MNTEKKIRKLEKKLEKMKSLHKSMWETYGSELCAGEMHNKEKDLEDKILKLKVY